MAVTRSKFSVRQAGARVAVDVNALSPRARERRIDIDLPATTANTTTYSAMRASGEPGTLVSGYAVFRTKPVIDDPGTITLTIDHVAADGSTVTTLVDAQTLEGKTDLVPFALTLAATPAMLATGSIRTSIATSNHTVSTAQVGGTVVLIYKPTEDAVISDTDNIGQG